MRKVLLAGYILLGLTGVGVAMENNNAGTKQEKIPQRVKDEMAKAFPNLQFGAINGNPKLSEETGLYEVIVGGEIYYFSPKGYIFVGKILTADGRDLTREKLVKLQAERVKTMPLQKALKIGNGPNTVIEFTDPDCPFCRKVHKYLSSRSDLTRYIFLFPLPMHPDAPRKVAYILSAKDQASALKEVFSGQLDNKTSAGPQSTETMKQVEELVTIARTLGVRGTPNLWVNGTFVGGADIAQIASLLSGGKEVVKK
ncbi:MAG: DsbC family protein [Geobacteraceae bacterium]|nr:DsbC family protein [Geobacteraceae bacterium]